MKVKFINVESPGKDLEFNLDCKKNYHLLDGEVYDLSQRVVEHLNSLGYPIYEEVVDEKTKQPYSKKVGFRNRFSVVPVGNDSLISTEPKRKAGRPPKEQKPELSQVG